MTTLLRCKYTLFISFSYTGSSVGLSSAGMAEMVPGFRDMRVSEADHFSRPPGLPISKRLLSLNRNREVASTSNTMKILIDNGHGSNTQGKRSPDGSIREFSYNREIARRVVSDLQDRGYDAALLVPEEEDISLGERIKRINSLCKLCGKQNVILVSIHVNAAKSDGKWHNATGWSIYTSTGKTRADDLATCIARAAIKALEGKHIRTDWADGDIDIEENFALLCKTQCAACLTENFFMDSLQDRDYLLSSKGKSAITQLHVEGICDFLDSI